MPKSYQGVTSNIHIKSLNICNIAFDAFFEDTKALVAKGVRTDIAHQKASAPTKKLFAQISDYASTRESSLAAWLKIDHPLAFQDTKGNNVYKLLLQAVSQDDHAVAQGLPNWSLFATTRLALAESLFLMSHPSHRSDQNTPTAKAPVLSTGSFFPVLKVVNHALVVLSRARDKEAIKSFVLNAFMMSFDIFKVDFFPQCLPPTGVRGRPQSTPLFNSWGHLGNLHHPIVSMNVPSPSPLVPPLNVAYNNANADNCHGPWTVTDLKLENVRSIILKSTLPTDYEIPAGAKDQYVIDTYAWVKQNYDHNKTLHHLALLVAIVAASFLPYLFIPTDLKHLFTNAHTNADVRKVYEQIDWIDKPKQNGMVKRGIFVAMFTTYIIAIYEPESPLRTYMKSAKKGGLGEGWRNKHSKLFLLFSFLSIPSLSPSRGQRYHISTLHPSRRLVGQGHRCLRQGNVP